jgi:transcriptional regulator with XRE-family HTH domain
MTRVRLNNRLTQTQTAELIGISAPSLSKWEAQKTLPRRKWLPKIIEFNEAYGPTVVRPVEKEATTSERHVVARQNAVPLRFKGVKLGSYLLSDGDVLTLYRTDGGQVVWDTDGTVNYGTTEAFVDYWAGFSEYREVLAFAADSGLEIFEDID